MGWRDVKQKMMEHLTENLALPAEVFLDLPRIVLIGDRQVYIENHRGILAYQEDSIKVNTGCGELVIEGRELVLRNILTDEIAIEGSLKGISFQR